MIEILTFRLVDGADERAFVDADTRVLTGFRYRQPGFLRSTTGRNDDGRWIVLVIWATPEAAEDARVAFEASDFAPEFSAFVDQATVVRDRFVGLD
ncbi:MAG: hypothetical protein WBP59_16435 [Ilumatobacteraceae bacterium]